MLHSQLKRPTVTISTLFQRPPYEGVGKCDFRVTAGCGKKLMSFQTTKGVTAATPIEIRNSYFQSFAELGPRRLRYAPGYAQLFCII